MKIAIVGSGIAGLSAAHRLTPHHLSGTIDLTVFESEPRTGGHSNTIEVESELGTERVDTGFIVFNERNYPEFCAILDDLNVASRPSNMSFSVSDDEFEFSGRSLRGLFARPRDLVDPTHLRMLAEVPKLQRRLRDLARNSQVELTLAEFLESGKYSEALVKRVVMPMVSSVWSADLSRIDEFPVGFLARFLDNHGLLSLADRPKWRTIEGGSRTYVEEICRPLGDVVRNRNRVERVVRQGGGVTLKIAGNGSEHFDRVILATHSDQSLKMLADPTGDEVRLLSAIPYQPNEAVLHTDSSVMPARSAAWASWNYHLAESGEGLTTLTYDMNRLQSLSCREQFFVSLNITDRIDQEKVLGSWVYEHPVFTPEGVAAQASWEEVSGADRVHFAGAWLANGFHEDGAASGRRAAKQIIEEIRERPPLAIAA